MTDLTAALEAQIHEAFHKYLHHGPGLVQTTGVFVEDVAKAFKAGFMAALQSHAEAADCVFTKAIRRAAELNRVALERSEIPTAVTVWKVSDGSYRVAPTIAPDVDGFIGIYQPVKPQPQEQSAGGDLYKTVDRVLSEWPSKPDEFNHYNWDSGNIQAFVARVFAALQPSAQQKQNNFKVGVESDTKRNGEILDTPQSSDLACKMLSDHQPSAQPEKVDDIKWAAWRAMPKGDSYTSACVWAVIDYLRDNGHLKLRGDHE